MGLVSVFLNGGRVLGAALILVSRLMRPTPPDKGKVWKKTVSKSSLRTRKRSRLVPSGVARGWVNRRIGSAVHAHEAPDSASGSSTHVCHLLGGGAWQLSRPSLVFELNDC